jgi:5'-nucleotidase
MINQVRLPRGSAASLQCEPPEARTCSMYTHSRVSFHPFAPRLDEILIEDIAHHLSRESRFAGAYDVEWYSVAEHSILVSHLARRRAEARGWPPVDCLRIALAGLVHDGSEACFKDLPAPLKHRPELCAYCEAEDHLLTMIYQRFGCLLCPEEESVVKEADLALSHYEAAHIFCPALPWAQPDPELSLPISAWRPAIPRMSSCTRSTLYRVCCRKHPWRFLPPRLPQSTSHLSFIFPQQFHPQI